MFNSLRKIYHEFPQKFWIVVGVSFIDRVGGTMLFPFFSLYITSKFGVGMTEAGIILGMFSVFGLIGGIIGGALTDRFGRRKLIISGLVFSAISTLTLGSVNEFAALYPLALLVGFLSDIGGPAHSAMIADILPENKRQEGFGILRVVANMAWIIGPTIGGVVANQSFFALFVIDAIISSIVALLFYLLMPETKPEAQPGQAHESILQTFIGYRVALRDFAFMAFLAAGVLMGMVYQQMYNSLSVYLRDVHGISTQGYGFLLTVSAICVIIFQFSVTRIVRRKPPFLMMALGTLFYAAGFLMFGFVNLYVLFAAGIIVITIGEMIIMPITQALVASFSPVDMRGRYMAVYGLMWSIPSTVAPSLAGVVLDNFNPNLLWYIGGALCVVAALGFYSLHARLGKQERFAPQGPEQIEATPAD